MGFEFIFGNKYLGKSRFISDKEMDKIDFRNRNDDSIPCVVKCFSCGIYMDYKKGDRGIFDSYWVCPSCKRKIKEEAIYNKLEKENEYWLKNNMPSLNDEPECCIACGGPWPYCKTTCKIFDA